MFRKLRRISMGFGVAAMSLALASWVSVFEPGPAPAQDGIDEIITGSITVASMAPVSQPANGSGAFRSGLDMLVGGDPAGAYAFGRNLPNALERRTLQWAAIYFGSGKVDHASVKRFAADAPAFASAGIYKTRMEQALTRADAPKDEVIALLGGAMPNTVDAQIALASAYLDDGQKARAARIARSIWVDNVLDQDSEKKVLASLGDLLDRDAHWARATYLMMNDRATAVERLLPYLSANQQALAKARNAVSRKDDNAKALLDGVPAAYQDNAVFIFSRAQRARQFELWESALDWLNKGKGDLPDPAEWWTERRTLIRAMLAAGQTRLAYKAAAGYTQGSEGRVMEARFLSGWIALNFLNDAATAKGQFAAMRKLATQPNSIAQAEYWLGRTESRLGDGAASKAAYGRAADFGTIYYGLLARSELGMAIEIRAMPPSAAREASFSSNEVVRAVKLLAENGRRAYAATLLRHYANGLSDSGDMVLAARLAQQIGAHNIAVLIGEIADARGIPLDLFSFPKDGLPTDGKLANIDLAAIYAVARQESRFQVDALSGVGARGLMQLMPATAEETATKLGLEYSPNRLVTDAGYNALLGSTYLAGQLDRFDNSLVLAAIAYNAGAGNARKWIEAYGDPRTGDIDPVIWIELIPFQETRNYVQHVLGNYLIYRARLGDERLTMKQVLRRIPG